MERPMTAATPPVKVDLRLLRAVAQDSTVRSCHVRVLRLLSQVQSLQRDTPQWEAAAAAMTTACQDRAAAFDAWMATRKAVGNGP